jgi:hypothetical protein
MEALSTSRLRCAFIRAPGRTKATALGVMPRKDSAKQLLRGCVSVQFSE